MSESQWYIVKQADGRCAIVSTLPAAEAEKWGQKRKATHTCLEVHPFRPTQT